MYVGLDPEGVRTILGANGGWCHGDVEVCVELNSLPSPAAVCRSRYAGGWPHSFPMPTRLITSVLVVLAYVQYVCVVW